MQYQHERDGERARTRTRLLVVDDDPNCRALLDAIFDMYGYEVATTDTVFGASALLASFKPDVVLLDLMLPYRSGASWLSELRAQPETASLPVVVLSGLPEVLPRDRRRLATAVVRKPFRTLALVDTVRRALLQTAPVHTVATNGLASIQPLGSL